MASEALKITIDDAQVVSLFERAPEAVRTRLGRLIETAAIDIQRQMILAAPVAVTGHLRRSITYRYTPANLSAVIGPSANYAKYVESGTDPHYVSVAEGTPLRAWALQKGINPYALQASIARKGTKAHPFVEPTYKKMKPRVEADIASGMTKLIQELTA